MSMGDRLDGATRRFAESRIATWATAVEATPSAPFLTTVWGLRRVWLVFGSWLLIVQLIPFTLAALTDSLAAKNWIYLAFNLAMSISVTFSVSSIVRSERSIAESQAWIADFDRRYGR